MRSALGKTGFEAVHTSGLSTDSANNKPKEYRETCLSHAKHAVNKCRMNSRLSQCGSRFPEIVTLVPVIGFQENS